MRVPLAILAAAGVVLGGLFASASGADRSARARAVAMVAAGSAGTHVDVSATGDETRRRTGAVQTDTLAVRSGESIARGGIEGRTATARASAAARSVNVLGGRVTAYGVRRVMTDGPDGMLLEGRVDGLEIDGRMIGDVAEERTYPLEGGGSVVVNRGGVGLAVTSADGTDVRVAVVRGVARQGAKPAPRPTATPTPAASPAGSKPEGDRDGKRSDRGKRRGRKAKRPPRLPAYLMRGGYAFPVHSPKATIADDFGGPRQIGPHQGNDVFAPFGSPVLAVSDGRLAKVGTLPISGNRLWVVSDRGDAFFYAHLSAFSPIAENGRRVKAGDVLGFVGNTGDAEPTPPHVHFEIHPGGIDRGAADPHRALLTWQRRGDVEPSAWLERMGADTAERPGALVEVRDFIAGE